MKLIEIHQENEIECDNPSCDFVIKNETGDPFKDSSQYINQPCPKCGENLLTKKDYNDYNNFMRLVKRVNFWFGRLAVFFGKKRIVMGDSVTVKVHNGIKINH